MSRALAFFGVAAIAAIASVSCGARSELNDMVASDAGVAFDAGDADADAAVPCVPGNFALKKAQPSVMFVLDASGSMGFSFAPDNSSRWQVLTQSLGAALPPVDSSMQIGALIFPSDRSNPSTCSTPSSADLAPATGNVSALIDLMQGVGPKGGTPTAAAIEVAATVLHGVRAASTARAMVLATDGSPNCDPDLDWQTCTCADAPNCPDQSHPDPELCLDDARTVKTISDNAASGLPTYVIGIHDPGDTQDDDVLNAMADAGGRARAGSPRYYPATSASDLGDALVSIRDQLGSCTYLTSSVPSATGTITVTIGGVVIPYDSTGKSGWMWADQSNGEIVFGGKTCSEVASPDAGAIEADVSCFADAGTGADAGKKSDAGIDAGIEDAGPDGS